MVWYRPPRCHIMIWDGIDPLGAIPQWDSMGFHWYHTMVWYRYGISYGIFEWDIPLLAVGSLSLAIDAGHTSLEWD